MFNVGNSNPVLMKDFLALLENAMGKRAIIENEPMQTGDVYQTCADTSKLHTYIGYSQIRI